MEKKASPFIKMGRVQHKHHEAMSSKQHVVRAEYVLGSVLRAQVTWRRSDEEAANRGHLLFKADFPLRPVHSTARAPPREPLLVARCTRHGRYLKH